MYLLYEIDYFDDNQHRQEGKNGKIIFNILGSSTELTTMAKLVKFLALSSNWKMLRKNASDVSVLHNRIFTLCIY